MKGPLHEIMGDVIEKVGGAFKASTLLQKRAQQLIRGARPLIQTDETNPIIVAALEVLAGAIELEQSTGRVVQRWDAGPEPDRQESTSVSA